MKYSAISLTVLMLNAPFVISAYAAPSPIIGVWETQRKEDENKIAHVKIAPCQNNPAHLCGNIVWMEQPNDPATGKPQLDKNNADESKKTSPVLNMQMMSNFKPANDTLTKYDDGEIYSALTGKTYNGDIELVDSDTLNLTGYVFVFSKTQTWKRVKGSVAKN
jgi:uncharacterized protein (DUF2147 family)